jgi:hypothetical protein
MSTKLLNEIEIDIHAVLFALVHKLSPGKPVTLGEADMRAAWEAFAPSMPCLASSQAEDGTLTFEVTSVEHAKAQHELIVARRNGQVS